MLVLSPNLVSMFYLASPAKSWILSSLKGIPKAILVQSEFLSDKSDFAKRAIL